MNVSFSDNHWVTVSETKGQDGGTHTAERIVRLAITTGRGEEAVTTELELHPDLAVRLGADLITRAFECDVSSLRSRGETYKRMGLLR